MALQLRYSSLHTFNFNEVPSHERSNETLTQKKRVGGVSQIPHGFDYARLRRNIFPRVFRIGTFHVLFSRRFSLILAVAIWNRKENKR